MSRARGRKRLLGMTINAKPNYAKQEYKRYRGIVHRCYYRGFAEAARGVDPEKFKTRLRGKISWIGLVHPEKGAKLKKVFDAAIQKEKEDERVA